MICSLKWLTLVVFFSALSAGSCETILILDLNADKKVRVNSENKVISWGNSAIHQSITEFIGQDIGRKVAGSGLPKWGKKDPLIGGHRTLHFKQQELVCFDEDAFDGLTTGKGYTWFSVVSVLEQRVGVKDVNSFFGNLRNGGKYEGLWGCLEDNNLLWAGVRNGKTFGRFDMNNPKLSGPVLQKNRYYLIASRMHKGQGDMKVELFLNDIKPVATVHFPVMPEANPSKLVVGQERDAVEHPGKESFDGSIARLLIYEGGLDDVKFRQKINELMKMYKIKRGE
jgi:hypothetical protein